MGGMSSLVKPSSRYSCLMSSTVWIRLFASIFPVNFASIASISVKKYFYLLRFDMDAALAMSIGVYQMYDNLSNIIKTDDVPMSKQYITLSIIASSLWLIHQYRTGMNFTSIYTILALILNLYILHVIYLKERKDKKI
mgnify:CR=1 FL=1